MPVMSQRPDGSWEPACPLPLWVGLRHRTAQCECKQRFASYPAYETHWRNTHAPVDPFRKIAFVPPPSTRKKLGHLLSRIGHWMSSGGLDILNRRR
jgi:hypothetical protein